MKKGIIGGLPAQQWDVPRTCSLLPGLLLAVMLTVSLRVCAQTMIGTVGQMNIPTADMRDAGTFDAGISFIHKELQPARYDYSTGLYYIDLTPFSFMEITYRETLLKAKNAEGRMTYHRQDRSTTLRLRPLRETADGWWPGIVIGVNDIYSDHGGSPYTSAYLVVTRHLRLSSAFIMAASLGYAIPWDHADCYKGLFGGVSLSPVLLPEFRLMAEHDTRGVNFGVSARLFGHLNLSAFSRELEGFCATLSYQYTIPY